MICSEITDKDCVKERYHWCKSNKKLIRRWDSERELSLRRHHTRSTKYNRLVHKFCHRLTRLRVGTQVYQIQWNGWLLVKFLLARGECLAFVLSLGWSPANIAISDVLLKTRFFGLHFRCRKYWCIFNHFYVIRLKATEFGEIMRPLGLLRRSGSSKVTEFGTNRKLICDFLLVINTNLAAILHRFRDIAFDRSKITIFGYRS